MTERLTVGEALARFRAANGLPAAADRASRWTCRLGPVTLLLPNFRWRRAAILRHDLHHVVTGYPCGLRGECQMAAWEFAAGRFPHPAATLFCLPLVVLGLFWSPPAIWRAFRAGRRRRSLYGTAVTEVLLRAPLARLRTDLVASRPRTPVSDGFAFMVLVLRAAALLLLPAVALGLGALLRWIG